MLLALANDRQLKNFTPVIPTDHNVDSVLMVEFIRDFRRPAVLQTNQEQVAHKHQIMTKAVWLYLPRLQ
jgi:hypothetical protein